MRIKYFILIVILCLTLVTAYSIPQKKYRGFDVIQYIDIPLEFSGWKGREIPTDNDNDDNFIFINKSHRYSFWSEDRSLVYLTFLNAVNFHHPKICYLNTGYIPQYNGPRTIMLENNFKLQIDTMLMSKENRSFLTSYWMCIDGEKAGWLKQQLNEIFRSVLNKKTVSLLTRIDVPTSPDNPDKAMTITQKFIKDMYDTLTPDKVRYIFGKQKK